MILVQLNYVDLPLPQPFLQLDAPSPSTPAVGVAWFLRTGVLRVSRC